MIEKLLSPEVQKFIKDHQSDDPFLLSLNIKEAGDFPTREVIEQIESLQKAQQKLPSWVSKEGILWPPPASVEQSSSEITARFKSTLVHGKSIVDLTGGMGVDIAFLSYKFEEAHYVDPNEHLCHIARHNFNLLGLGGIQIHVKTAETFLAENQKKIDTIFIDPSRRIENKRVFKVEDCSPNLYDIIPKCKSISDLILIKLSPLVDPSLLIREFAPVAIWILSIKNEVKEVLCQIQNDRKPTRIHAVDHDAQGQVISEFKFLHHTEADTLSDFSLPLKYLYEPNAAIMKAGAFKLIGKHFGLKKLHKHTHLYTSDEIIDYFPGKVFVIEKQLKQDKKTIKAIIPEGKVNVIARNFPLSSTQLKNKFNLKDGGDNFLIGTTLFHGKSTLLLCKRLQ